MLFFKLFFFNFAICRKEPEILLVKNVNKLKRIFLLCLDACYFEPSIRPDQVNQLEWIFFLRVHGTVLKPAIKEYRIGWSGPPR